MARQAQVFLNLTLPLALDILVKAIEKAGYTGKIKIGMDVAASEFYDEKEKKYDLNNKEKDHPHYVNLVRWLRAHGIIVRLSSS